MALETTKKKTTEPSDRYFDVLKQLVVAVVLKIMIKDKVSQSVSDSTSDGFETRDLINSNPEDRTPNQYIYISIYMRISLLRKYRLTVTFHHSS